MSIVARVLDPGCQQDHVPIFEGEQGTRKSSMLRVIGGDWFAEVTADMKDKDFLQNMRGKMLLEIGELAAMSKHEQEKVKQVITNRSDTYRASYGRMSGTYDRQCTFAGTTNRNDWVRDETGARRYWRVITGQLRPEWVEERRDQIFAEAVHRYNSGECYWEVPQDEARRLTDDARERDPWANAILHWAGQQSDVSPEDALSMLEIPLERQDGRMIARVRSILRGAGYKSVNARKFGSVVKVWRRDYVPTPPPVDYDAL
jgi:putative DNA primase/helicase